MNSLRRIVALAVKELLAILRDPKSRLVLMPASVSFLIW